MSSFIIMMKRVLSFLFSVLVFCPSVRLFSALLSNASKELFKRGGLAEDGAACVKHVAEIIEGTGADIHADPVLNSACAVDLRKFCRDVSPGEGRVFACLVAVSKEKSFSLEMECQAVLAKRIEMFGLALKVINKHVYIKSFIIFPDEPSGVCRGSV